MFGIGIPEFILILVVGLVVFGPSKLPEIGRAVGKGLREFKKASNAFQNILNAPDDTPTKSMAATHGVRDFAKENIESAETVSSVETNAPPKYVPPTKESVQAEIEKKNAEKIDNNNEVK